MKQLSNKYHLSFVLTFAFVIFANAQRTPPPPLGEDQPVFPVDDYVFIAVIVAAFLGYYITIHRVKKENL
ncbi:hypothetical protein FVB9288_02924 [Flavobacterium sp. CECT 9288]|jgi:hypothetical protein|uniref:hypothetical protein n=1 Tax=Flavobacterium sp. CECT 9288 TaxID=2845819 RepID=UPI001E3A7F8D|nr:hypothetical protein [Flavobacterium sp. CECT 9288]CAH0337177.1 hypothetical protein FVB9288_02924 [Flavobacterium sp. CECT 9288]